LFSESICISVSSRPSKLVAGHKDPPAVGLAKNLEMPVSLLFLAESKC